MNFPGTNTPITPQLLRDHREACNLSGPEMAKVDYSGLLANWDHWRNARPLGAWRSRKFLAVHWREPNGHERLSVNRVEVNTATGDWKDGISWEDLMRVKRECGFGDRHCIELYPADANIVNVANLRHLWFVERPPQTW